MWTKQVKIVAIDIDLKDNGMDYWQDLLYKNNNDKDLDTLKVRTGGGGMHYFFNYTADMDSWYSINKMFSDGDKKTGIDFRSRGGYLIVPPSLHPSSNFYKFLNCNIEDNIRSKIQNIPKWLFYLVDDYFIKLAKIKKDKEDGN